MMTAPKVQWLNPFKDWSPVAAEPMDQVAGDQVLLAGSSR